MKSIENRIKYMVGAPKLYLNRQRKIITMKKRKNPEDKARVFLLTRGAIGKINLLNK